MSNNVTPEWLRNEASFIEQDCHQVSSDVAARQLRVAADALEEEKNKALNADRYVLYLRHVIEEAAKDLEESAAPFDRACSRLRKVQVAGQENEEGEQHLPNGASCVQPTTHNNTSDLLSKYNYWVRKVIS